MRPRGPLGANLRRLRGYVRPVPPGAVELGEAIEAGRLIPSEPALEQLGRRLGLELPALRELEECRRIAAGRARVARRRSA